MVAKWENKVITPDWISGSGKMYEGNKVIATVTYRRPNLTPEELVKASEPFERLRAKMVREGKIPPAECD